jgi:hypothetical protein
MFDRTTTAEPIYIAGNTEKNSRSVGNPGGPLVVEQVFAQLEPIAIQRGSDGAGDK